MSIIYTGVVGFRSWALGMDGREVTIQRRERRGECPVIEEVPLSTLVVVSGLLPHSSMLNASSDPQINNLSELSLVLPATGAR